MGVVGVVGGVGGRECSSTSSSRLTASRAVVVGIVSGLVESFERLLEFPIRLLLDGRRLGASWSSGGRASIHSEYSLSCLYIVPESFAGKDEESEPS